MKSVLFYESAPDVAVRAPLHYAAHSAHVREFHERGVLLMIGVFADVQNDGAMAVFVDRAAAEEFAGRDPFVVNGVVSGWRVSEWAEVLTGEGSRG
ncbi:YciI family protein [Streptomyces sp. NBC_01198]|uniref:YciI family protein n=1 Tax=Streptomyces sp. NBC_01198 TaxID=2903769 RepID=UPI002E1014E6|nr:YciI family protein [Streptomyces sp. NBC_01198]